MQDRNTRLLKRLKGEDQELFRRVSYREDSDEFVGEYEVGLAQPLAVLRQQVDRAANANGLHVNWKVEGETVRPTRASWVLNTSLNLALI